MPVLNALNANRRRAVRTRRMSSSVQDAVSAASTRMRKGSIQDDSKAAKAALESRMRQAQLRMQGQDPELMKALFGLDADSLLWKDDLGNLRPAWWIWHPLAWSRFCWDCLAALLILISTIETPFTIAFLSTTDLSIGHRIFNYAIDGFMMLDVVSNFFTGFVDEDERVCMDQKLIAKRYVKGWFLVELISSLPIADLLPVSRAFLRSLRVLRLVRLLRVQRLMRYIARWQDDVTWSHTTIRLVKLLIAVFTYVHLSACLQFGTPALQSFPVDSWVHAAELPIDSLPESNAVMHCYTVAFFTAFSNALCVSYGVVTPSRIEELWVMLLSMVSGASMYAVALAVACNILQSVDHASRRYQNTLAELGEMMRVRCFPKSLKDRVRKLLEIEYPNRRMFSSSLMEKEFSSALALETRMTQCATLFAVTPIFQDAERAFLSAMAGALEIEFSQPGDWLTREHEVVRHVFFVQQGRVEVLIDAHPVAELVEGAYIGEITALGLNDDDDIDDGEDPIKCAATASVRSIEVTTLCIVPRARFRAIVAHYPAVKNAMRVVAQLRHARGHATPFGASPFGDSRVSSRRWQAISELTREDMEEYVCAQRISAIQQHEKEVEERKTQDFERRSQTTGCERRHSTACGADQRSAVDRKVSFGVPAQQAARSAQSRRLSLTEMRRNRKASPSKENARRDSRAGRMQSL